MNFDDRQELSEAYFKLDHACIYQCGGHTGEGSAYSILEDARTDVRNELFKALTQPLAHPVQLETLLSLAQRRQFREEHHD